MELVAGLNFLFSPYKVMSGKQLDFLLMQMRHTHIPALWPWTMMYTHPKSLCPLSKGLNSSCSPQLNELFNEACLPEKSALATLNLRCSATPAVPALFSLSNHTGLIV